MTFAGKLLLMVNLAFSMMMATVALALYTSGLDYYGTKEAKDATPKPPPRITALANEITELQKTIPAVMNSWREARFANRNDYRGLLTLEEQRHKDRAEYNRHLRLLRGGVPGVPDRQVQEVEIRDHLPVPNPGATPPLRFANALDRSGKPLMPLATYFAEMEKARQANAAVQESLQLEIAKGIALTNQLTGTPDKRGLRQMLIDERLKREGVMTEYESLRPLFVNTSLEAQVMRSRIEAMKEQIEQLNRYLRMKQKLDVVAKGR